jgi:hypothetical protein
MRPEDVGIAQFLQISSAFGVLHRFQSRWVGATVTHNSLPWRWHPFSSDGMVAGNAESESSLGLQMPATAISLPIMRKALAAGHTAEITIYEFEPLEGVSGPPSSMALVGSYIGQVTGLSGFETLEVSIGTALAPVGVQFPPRTMTSYLIGVPCQL